MHEYKLYFMQTFFLCQNVICTNELLTLVWNMKFYQCIQLRPAALISSLILQLLWCTCHLSNAVFEWLLLLRTCRLPRLICCHFPTDHHTRRHSGTCGVHILPIYDLYAFRNELLHQAVLIHHSHFSYHLSTAQCMSLHCEPNEMCHTHGRDHVWINPNSYFHLHIRT